LAANSPANPLGAMPGETAGVLRKHTLLNRDGLVKCANPTPNLRVGAEFGPLVAYRRSEAYDLGTFSPASRNM